MTSKINKKEQKNSIERQQITSKGGLAHGVYYTKDMAIDAHKMISNNLENMKNNHWAHKLNDPGVKLYCESIESKLTELMNIISFSDKK